MTAPTHSEYAPIVVYVFGEDPEPTEEWVRSILEEDLRIRPIQIHSVGGHSGAVSHFAQLARAPWRVYLSKSAPEKTRTIFLGHVVLPELPASQETSAAA